MTIGPYGIRLRHAAPRVLVLALLVLAHFLCSVCHAPIAATAAAAVSTDAPVATAPSVHTLAAAPAPTSAPASAATGVLPGSGADASAPHGSESGSAPVCHEAGDSSTDQRLAAGQLLLLLALSAGLLAAFGPTPPRVPSWPVRRRPAAARAGTRLLLSLCVQRV